MSNCNYDARICQILQQILTVLQQQGVVSLGDIANITEGVVPGTGFSDLGKSEDETHASGETGVLALAVRNDADVALTSADFDRSPIAVDSAGRVKFNSSITIGDIDNILVSVTPGTGAAHLGKAEDAPTASGHTGVGILLKRSDTAATQTSLDGDYTLPVANLNGVQLTAQDRTFQASDANGLLKAEDSAHASGDAGVFALGVATSGSTVFGAVGDYTPIAVSTKGSVLAAPAYDANLLSSIRATKLEDEASATGDAAVAIVVKRTDTAAAQTDTDGDYTVPVANSFGVQHVNIDSGFQTAAATGILKLEDTGHTTGHAGVFALGVRSDSPFVFTSNDSDYSPFTVNSFGAQQINVDSGFQRAAATGLLKLEDSVAASGDAGVAGLAVIEATPAASAADGDYGFRKLNAVGAQYNEPGHQVATYAYANYAEGSITNAFTTALTNSAKIKILTLKNLTNAALEISYDATNVHDYLEAGATLVYDFGTNGRWMSSNVSVRYVTNPTSGSLIVAGKI